MPHTERRWAPRAAMVPDAARHQHLAGDRRQEVGHLDEFAIQRVQRRAYGAGVGLYHGPRNRHEFVVVKGGQWTRLPLDVVGSSVKQALGIGQ